MKELSSEELQCVAGGDINWGQAGAAAGIIALGVAVVATGGIASIPLGLAGAATAGEVTLAGFGIVTSLIGGWGIGDALDQ